MEDYSDNILRYVKEAILMHHGFNAPKALVKSFNDVELKAARDILLKSAESGVPLLELKKEELDFLRKALVHERPYGDTEYFDTYDDWKYVLDYCKREVYPTVADENVPSNGFGIFDVEKVYARSAGCNDALDWLLFGKLKDGRYFYAEAWCDYTGWECQSGGRAHVSFNKDKLIQFGMSDKTRTRLRNAVAANV